MELYGKSRDEIAQLTRKKSRADLITLLWRHCSLEPFFSPEQIAQARGMAAKTAKQLMKSGKIRAHLPAGNRYRAPLSAVVDWDRETALALSEEKE